MSSADLDHIRALLVAQTAEPEPPAKGLLGRLFATRPEPPRPEPAPRFAAMLDLAAPVPGGIPADSACEQELLLEQICGPAATIESASPLPPLRPRAEFGRRPDLAPEPELVLDRPATAARRLQLLDPSGQPVGEMILHPNDPPGRIVAGAAGDEVPFFPEDFLDPAPSDEPQPLRPWLKALRQSGKPEPSRSATIHSQEAQSGDAESCEGGSLVKRVRQRRAQRHPMPKPPQTLSHDLLEALALALAREQENLSDRLLSVTDTSVFHRVMAAPAAA